VGSRTLISPYRQDWIVAHPANYPVDARIFFPGLKRQAREADNSPPPSQGQDDVYLYTNCPISEVEVTLRPMVGRAVRLGVLPLLEQVTRCYIYLSDNYFLYFSCRAPSLTTGRVCNLQCNDTS
jgi:hypothetical protein